MSLLEIPESKIAFIFLLIFSFLSVLPAQNTRRSLEERRRELMKDIGETNDLLKTIRKNQKTTVNQYITLQKQIGKRQELINTLEEELAMADSSINRAREVVFALADDVEVLKTEYGEMLREAYRMKLKNNSFLFVLSADSFNDAFRRWNYLKQYEEYRQKQAFLIEGTQSTLSRKASQLQEQREKKELLLQNELSQKNILTQELSTSDQLLARLRTDEVRVEQELTDKKTAHQNLKSSISKIISEEIARQKREEPKAPTSPKPKKKTESTTPSAPKINTAPAIADASVSKRTIRELSGNFRANRGNLPRPIERGVIIRKFGNQPHPALKNVRINNNGIDFQTNANAQVNAVFDGEVLGVKFIPGNNYMVILQHGEYFTVYSNLEKVLLRRGTKVRTGEVLGQAGLDKISGEYEVHFEVWKNKTLENPEGWISKR